jgi:hypothetical protein
MVNPIYTQISSKIGFWLRQLGCKFLFFARALPIWQWSLGPDPKICAASLPNSQLLNSFVYIPFFERDTDIDKCKRVIPPCGG